MPVRPQGCIIAQYLAKEEVDCRRMERTANPDTPQGKEWRQIAETLCVLRVDHVARCGKCKPVPVNGVVKHER
jgi:hypothetical protein